mmetsp:Transcript_17152/g.36845  ORF Transcript_17152/g.36845 Transcript_17152/m.36845 type:complete len:201 (-) Transcript_17152:935-1537(-)
MQLPLQKLLSSLQSRRPSMEGRLLQRWKITVPGLSAPSMLCFSSQFFSVFGVRGSELAEEPPVLVPQGSDRLQAVQNLCPYHVLEARNNLHARVEETAWVHAVREAKHGAFRSAYSWAAIAYTVWKKLGFPPYKIIRKEDQVGQLADAIAIGVLLNNAVHDPGARPSAVRVRLEVISRSVAIAPKLGVDAQCWVVGELRK